MCVNHQLLGLRGENLAVDYLEQLNFQILDRNWRYKRAEVDIVALKQQKVIFVEVKARSGYGFGQPEEFVGLAKQRLMENAALAYIHRIKHSGEIRFDIISVLFDLSGGHSLRHIEDAFWPGFS